MAQTRTHRPLSHYGRDYQSEERWLSYVRQTSLARELVPRRALEVGVGAGALRAIFSVAFPQCEFIGFDIRRDLPLDVQGDVRQLPFSERCFDIVYCCQVLEHLHYADFGRAVAEVQRVAARRLVVSLPDDGPFVYARIRGFRRVLPRLWEGISLPGWRRAIEVEQHGQHYWEIGRRGYPAERVRGDMQHPDFRLADEFRMVERPYWHFFVLDRLVP